MRIGKDQKIYFNEVLKGTKFNNETFREIAEMLSLFYFNERILDEKFRKNKKRVKRNKK